MTACDEPTVVQRVTAEEFIRRYTLSDIEPAEKEKQSATKSSLGLGRL